MSKKHYDGDSILHRLFSLLFWFIVCGGVCLLIGATLMLGFTTGLKPTHFNEFIGLLVLSTCAFPVLLLAVYRSFLYIIYGGKVAYKFKNHWQAAFVPTLLLSVLMITGYIVTTFGNYKENKTISTVLSNNSKTNKNYSNSPTVKPEPPETSIWDAAKLGKIEALKNHLAIGTDVNKLNKYGQTLLHIATHWGQTEIAELLISNNASVYAKDASGATPLHIAVGNRVHDPVWSYKQSIITRLLLKNHSNVNALTDKGNTTLDVARNQTTADLLRKHGGKTKKELEAEGK